MKEEPHALNFKFLSPERRGGNDNISGAENWSEIEFRLENSCVPFAEAEADRLEERLAKKRLQPPSANLK